MYRGGLRAAPFLCAEHDRPPGGASPPSSPMARARSPTGEHSRYVCLRFDFSELPETPRRCWRRASRSTAAERSGWPPSAIPICSPRRGGVHHPRPPSVNGKLGELFACRRLRHSALRADLVESTPGKTMPRRPIDVNVRIDYTKLRHLLVVGRQLNGNFDLLRHLVGEENESSASPSTPGFATTSRAGRCCRGSWRRTWASASSSCCVRRRSARRGTRTWRWEPDVVRFPQTRYGYLVELQHEIASRDFI